MRVPPISVINFLMLLLIGAGVAAPQNSAVHVENHPANTATQQAKPYVVLVSLDGFRYDYAAKFNASHLKAMAAAGASAPEGMIPSYPSITFPNHYSIVTGLYPEHHGIVAMGFYDPERKQKYTFNDPATYADGSWYGGTPLWSLAEKQGMRTACFFWPGSEAEIAGSRPSYWLHYQDNFPDERRVDQILAWLNLPPGQRPHFLTLYLANVDHNGHLFGVDSLENQDAVHHVDEIVGKLEAGLKATKLPVNLIVVSDHGMENRQGDWINLDRYADLTGFETDGSLLYAPSEASAEKAYKQLHNASDKFAVYRRKDLPKHLHFKTNGRAGDPVVVPLGPYAIRAHPRAQGQDRPPNKGMHGFDPKEMKNMRAIFYAEGPAIRHGVTVQPFENIDVYPFIAHILGLNTPKTDATLKPLKKLLAR